MHAPTAGDRRWVALLDVTGLALLYVADWRGLVPLNDTPWLVLLGWLSLRLRGLRWRDIGLARYRSWARTLLVGTVCGVVIETFQLLVCQPVVARLFGAEPDLSSFHELAGNLKQTLIWVGISWVLAAFGEEMAYRGYILNRVADWGGGGRWAWVAAVVMVSSLFGIDHMDQGPTGMVVEGFSGLWLALAYLGAGRNLFIPIIAHGVANTIDFVLIYLDRFPGM